MGLAMRKITLYATTGRAGSKVTQTIEVDDECTDEEIEEILSDNLSNLVEYGWYPAEEEP